MKKIEINIKYPYKKYFAFKSLRSNVEMVFPKLEIGDNDSVISTINRIYADCQGDFRRVKRAVWATLKKAA